MRIAVNGNRLTRPGDLTVIRAHAEAVARDGLAGYWLAQDPVGAFDALTALTAIAPTVPDVELGTAVVPTWPRHPAVLAAQALTADQACEGRLTLGIGLSHPAMMRLLGIDYDRPLEHAREYLTVLLALLAGEEVDYEGRRIACRTSMVRVRDDAPAVLLAALGPKMLALAGELAAGSITTWTGPRTIRDYLRPTIDAAADAANRPRPRVISTVSVCVTDDEEAARTAIDGWYGLFGDAPSYTASLAREDAQRPSDVQLVGSEAKVLDGLAAYRDAGVDDLMVGEVVVEPEDAERTRALLRSVAPSFD